MSRIGNYPIAIPDGVNVAVEEQRVRVKGPKGELELDVRPELAVAVEDGEVRVSRSSDSRQHRALHGLTRSLIGNMVTGVSEGYRKELEIVGVGFRADKRGKSLVLNVGFSHQVKYPEPEGITISTEGTTRIIIEGADKQKVGQVAAEIRAVRPPEPYKGKGIRYADERVRRKAGKAAV